MARTTKIAVQQMTDEAFDELVRTRHRVVDWEPFIAIDPEIAFGKPRVKGTRLAAEFILDLYAAGWSDAQVLESYPNLTIEAIRAVFAYAADCVSEKQVAPWSENE